MSTEGWLAAGFGGVFVLLLFATAIWLIASERQVPDTPQRVPARSGGAAAHSREPAERPGQSGRGADSGERGGRHSPRASGAAP